MRVRVPLDVQIIGQRSVAVADLHDREGVMGSIPIVGTSGIEQLVASHPHKVKALRRFTVVRIHLPLLELFAISIYLVIKGRKIKS